MNGFSTLSKISWVSLIASLIPASWNPFGISSSSSFHMLMQINYPTDVGWFQIWQLWQYFGVGWVITAFKLLSNLIWKPFVVSVLNKKISFTALSKVKSNGWYLLVRLWGTITISHLFSEHNYFRMPLPCPLNVSIITSECCSCGNPFSSFTCCRWGNMISSNLSMDLSVLD